MNYKFNGSTVEQISKIVKLTNLTNENLSDYFNNLEFTVNQDSQIVLSENIDPNYFIEIDKQITELEDYISGRSRSFFK